MPKNKDKIIINRTQEERAKICNEARFKLYMSDYGKDTKAKSGRVLYGSITDYPEFKKLNIMLDLYEKFGREFDTEIKVEQEHFKGTIVVRLFNDMNKSPFVTVHRRNWTQYENRPNDEEEKTEN